ncbi:MAG TPA: hypothetical protein VKU01_24680 [Bryobacteraceae bacterium]|nr:hypothetical protein [Bryobacteraceae bacterium]
MKVIKRATTSTFSAVVAGILFLPAASACGPTPQPAPYTIQQLLPDVHNPLGLATMASLARDRNNTSNADSAPIVGMWNIQFLSEGNTTHNPSIPDGAMIDFGYNQWHSDGTEILNSGARAPAMENFCLGVWEKTGHSTYQLNHFALNYDPGTGAFMGKINIVELITLSPGGTMYSGTFTYSVFDTKGNKTDQLTGQVAAVRITVDTTTP